MDNVVVRGQDVSLMEVLDRVLEKGVAISGDIVISVADVDLVFLGLRAILSSVETMEQARGYLGSGPMPREWPSTNDQCPRNDHAPRSNARCPELVVGG